MPWSIPTRLRLFFGVLCWVCSSRGWTPAEAAILNFTLEPKSSILVERNRAFTIECSANGVPIPKVYWWKDDAVLASSEDVRFTRKGLYFRAGVRESHLGSPRVGLLRCMARNSAGVLMSTKIALEIIYLGNITLTLHPPVVGHIARLECKLSSNQPVNITWFKDNQTINAALDTRLGVLPSGVLQIRDFRSSDNGMYSCRAENKYEGIASSPLQVFKQVRTRSQLHIYPGKAVNVKAGGELVLECLDSGSTLSNLTWSKFSQMRISVLASGRNFANLVINPVRVSDGGEYFCQGATGVREKVVMSVRVPPTFPTPLPSATKLNNGDKLTVACEPTGNPTPSLVWFRDGRRLFESGRVHFVRDNTVHKLVLDNVTLADSGVYQCEAENELGSSIEHTILDVAGDIGPPTNVRAHVLSSTVVNVTWSPPSGYSGQSAYYSVHYSEVIERTELQAITKDRATFQTIEYLKPYTEYLIYVKVFYSSKPTKRSEMVTVRTMDEVPTGPPLYVHLKSYTYGTLDITWLPPKLDERNGHVTGYNISIAYGTSGRQTHFITVVKNFYSFTVKNLVEGRKYFVTIAAGTGIGWGPFSEAFSCIVTRKSPVRVILPAPAISAKLVNSSIVVSVKPPVNPNVMGYHLTYWNMSDNDVQYRRVDFSTRTFEYRLTHLKVNSEYVINVTANGTGTTLSRPAIAVVASERELPNPDNTTMPDSPTIILPPMGFTCHHAQKSTALVLNWQRPSFQIRASKYRIKYFVMNNEKTSKFISTKSLNFTLLGLLPGTVYDVEIQSKRDGLFSAPVKPQSGKCTLPEKKPDTAPRDFTCEAGVDKIVLNWRTPERPNGKIIEYRLNWRDSKNKTRLTKYKSLGFLNHHKTTLENVIKDSCYVVSVDAVNSVGISPPAKCSIDTTKIVCHVSTTETSNGSKDPSSFEYDDITLGIIIGCVISSLLLIFLILYVLWSDPCRCRRHKQLREVEVETSFGTDNHPSNRLSKPDTNSTEVSDASSKHYQIFQKYFIEEASKESDRGLGMTPKNSRLCLDNEKVPFLQKTQHQDYSNGASFDSQDSGIQGLDKLEKGSSSSSSSSSTKDAQKRPPQSSCVVLETVC